MAFTVAIVGRPNVGKSTLFNRLVGRRAALVAPTPGVTRDRREGWARIGPLRFRAIDTAGLEEAAPETLAGRMMAQTERALAEADAALLVIDGRAGVTPADEFFANQLRRLQVPIVLAVNKCEGAAAEGGIAESYALGLGQPIPISAEHGEGLADLYDALSPFDSDAAPGAAATPGADDVLRLAIVGRPNVGKSTLLNRLVGEARVITGAEPGLTRDSIAVRWSYEGRSVELVDTAGLRRRARTVATLDRLSSRDAERALGQAAVVLAVFDATDPAGRQDMTIAARVAEEGRALVILLNKWDLVRDRAAARAAVEDRLEVALAQVKGVPLVTCSALTGAGAERIMPAVLAAFDTWNRRVPTAALNRWLEGAVDRHPPPLAAGRRLKLRYITQVKARPPTFALFASKPSALPESYRRYLVNGIGAEFGLAGVPIRLMLRAGKNPYAPS
ncbi:MAG: ribosome biogenesis GTPase Der [Rhodospirillales bacterium]|nr:ribosome biogenesis GTPase Der [Rhodospirillales bacterium]MDE0381010.1 ribosome biogenesis GTPase Der [Rhodospirillales bacterium]